ncbi:MAG: hypothetical protein KDD70_09480 [Bdellovibrionales bacterium]|nr:hypothetical protein [Bdellovibrionales bacterium]
MNRTFSAVWLLVFLLQCSVAIACDLCAVFNEIETQRGHTGSLNLGVAHQLTRSGSDIRPDSQPGLASQNLTTNITQLFGSYRFSRRFRLQLNVPLISRSFQRVVLGETDKGSVNGLGDVSLLAQLTPYEFHDEEWTFSSEVFSGVKFATGDDKRLKEELDELLSIVTGGSSSPENKVGGDDLALGSGSTDVLFGGTFFLRYQRAYLSGNFQYSLRNEGSYEYEYGDDIQWGIGPAYYLLLSDSGSIALRMRLSGEHKGDDKLLGVQLSSSDETALFLGPELVYSDNSSLTSRLRLELPVKRDSSEDQVVPELRFLASIALSF